MSKLKIVAGPCSLHQNNIDELYQIADLKINGERAVYGLRVVGLKSRTSYTTDTDSMGMDTQSALSNVDKAINGVLVDDWDSMPSIEIASEIHEKTGAVIATEVVLPHIQLPLYAKYFPQGGVIVWNPAPAQLGWYVFSMARYASACNWQVGLKNPKWSNLASDKGEQEETVLEKTWKGAVAYSEGAGADYFLIHRGVDTHDKGDYRSAPLHNIAEKMKKNTNRELFFDPSHSFGPKMRDKIVSETVKAMQMKIGGSYLYDGILVEVGTSTTDTEQHITIEELKEIIDRVSEFREVGV